LLSLILGNKNISFTRKEQLEKNLTLKILIKILNFKNINKNVTSNVKQLSSKN